MKLTTRMFLAPLAAALPLVACDSGPSIDEKNVSSKEVSRQVAAAGGTQSFVSPGKWKSTTKYEELEMPGMTPQMTKQMKAAMGEAHVGEQCLTADDVKQPKEDFFGGDAENCTYDHFKMAGGVIDAEMTCKEDGAVNKTSINGTYSSTAFQARMAVNVTGGQQSGMKMTASIDSRRVGDCTESD